RSFGRVQFGVCKRLAARLAFHTRLNNILITFHSHNLPRRVLRFFSTWAEALRGVASLPQDRGGAGMMHESPKDLGSSEREGKQGRAEKASSIAAYLGLVCVFYYLAAKVGFLLTFHPHPVSILWPTNAILMAMLLLAPGRRWSLILLAAFPAHVAV